MLREREKRVERERGRGRPAGRGGRLVVQDEDLERGPGRRELCDVGVGEEERGVPPEVERGQVRALEHRAEGVPGDEVAVGGVLGVHDGRRGPDEVEVELR